MFTEKGQLVVLFNHNDEPIDVHPIQHISDLIVVVGGAIFDLVDGKSNNEKEHLGLVYNNPNRPTEKHHFSVISSRIEPFDLSLLKYITFLDHKIEFDSAIGDLKSYMKDNFIPENALFNGSVNGLWSFSYSRKETYHEYAKRVFNSFHYHNDNSFALYS